MANFNLDNYETVEERLKVFWKDNPNANINTEVVHITDDGTCVTIKATIYIFQQDESIVAVSTGIAQETKGQGGFANKDAWVENCETSAIGRALANWKYQGSNKARPSREEMSKVGNSKPKVEVEKAEVKPMTKDEAVGLNKAAQEFAADIGAKATPVADQINSILEGMLPNKTKRDELKAKVYKELTDDGLNNDLETWTSTDCDVFITAFEQEMELIDSVSQVFDTDTVKVCPKCSQSGSIEDNRQKKADDPDKFGKIPDFACSSYNNAGGCGAGWWIGNEELPTEWL
jgi:predicted GNAT family acetyltransferase